MTEVIAVIGLGYVGLPIAVAFSRHKRVIGFDISENRIAELRAGFDRTGELDSDELGQLANLEFTNAEEELRHATIFIVCVPTPITSDKLPDLEPLRQSCRLLGRVIRQGSLVVFESTVYPGVTDEVCTPILELESGLHADVDFLVGYSPERLNPGDKSRTLRNIEKVVSGSSMRALDRTEALYRLVVEAPVHRAPSIRVAEAAKVIENTQRDLNIALVNEFSKVFHLLGIDTHDVLRAASTKWNFMAFSPGLVGGHCIGVDPYYLTFRAQELGYEPAVILAGRTINDSMGLYVADRVYSTLQSRRGDPTDWSALILGVTFKEDCPDIRNSQVPLLAKTLSLLGANVSVADPVVTTRTAELNDEIAWIEWESLFPASELPQEANFDVVIVAVPHRKILEQATALRGLVATRGILFDVKGLLPRNIVDARL